MKTDSYHFQWFEKEDARKTLRASVGKDGKMRLGRGLRERLPPHIRVGFDAKSRVLAIVKGTDADILWPKMGVFSMRALASQITSIGLVLPVSFQMADRLNEHCFYGKVIPRKHRQFRDSSQGPVYDTEQLMVLYRPLVDSLVYQLAKTTPLSERKSCAWEAFFDAVLSYTASQGDMEDYLARKVRTALIQHNRSFISAYRDKSMEAPLTSGDGSTFCLYDVIPDASSGGIDAVEAKIMEDQFMESLLPKEKKLYQMICSGSRLPQIAEELGMEEENVQALGQNIGKKRTAFYRTA